MAKSFTLGLLVASALCLSSLFAVAFAAAPSFVEGKVYCDTCRVEFQTELSLPIQGSKVKLECKSRENQTVTYGVEADTDNRGVYRLPVDDKDHAEEICEVKLVKSGMADCTELFNSADRARVVLAKNGGVVQQTRFANPLGFKKAKARDDCAGVLQKMGFLPNVN